MRNGDIHSIFNVEIPQGKLFCQIDELFKNFDILYKNCPLLRGGKKWNFLKNVKKINKIKK